jgi:hypothetical protein
MVNLASTRDCACGGGSNWCANTAQLAVVVIYTVIRAEHGVAKPPRRCVRRKSCAEAPRAVAIFRDGTGAGSVNAFAVTARNPALAAVGGIVSEVDPLAVATGLVWLAVTAAIEAADA